MNQQVLEELKLLKGGDMGLRCPVCAHFNTASRFMDAPDLGRGQWACPACGAVFGNVITGHRVMEKDGLPSMVVPDTEFRIERQMVLPTGDAL